MSSKKKLKNQQSQNNILYTVSNAINGQSLQMPAISSTNISTNIVLDDDDDIFGSNSLFGPVKPKRKYTRTDLLVWSQNRNYKCKSFYHVRKFVNYLTFKGDIVPGTGINSTKNPTARYMLYTDEEMKLIEDMSKTFDSLIEKFRERTKELKAQEFKI